MSLQIGFVGFGEVSSCFAKGFYDTEDVALYAYDTDVQKAKKQSASMGGIVKVADSLQELFSYTKNIIVAVPSRYNVSCFDAIFQTKVQGLLLMDFSSSLPDIKKDVAKKATDNLCKYVDVAVMGSVPKLLHRTPLYISGPNCEDMKTFFEDTSMSIKVKGDTIGTASTIKLCRSVYMKGLAALLIETQSVCDGFGVREDVYKSIAENLDNQPFLQYSERLINGAIRHSVRQRDEVDECIQMMESKNIESKMTTATLSIFNSLIDAK